ncbi:MAG: BatA domain-containing protein [Thermoguttaceae bacterium]|jgi:hypothetical protein|nr:BatA domain-containing protein [Thermoguttaceae bacterium]
MPGFVFQPLLWGLLLVGVPVLIHLINMLRHRRVPWAAMEFLLQSQKRNRTWIMLKQLLLLLMRMLAVAAVVLVLAQPLLRNELGRLFGGSKTHHIVLLDDSLSMSDRWADTSAFDQAKAVIRRIGAQAAAQQQRQEFTLMRFSRVAREHRGSEVDLLQAAVDRSFEADLERTLGGMRVSETAAGPLPALAEVQRLLGSTDNERRIVYLVSDFRTREWNEPTELRNRLLAITADGAELHLVNCVDQQRDNLAIVSLRASTGTRAVGVPIFVEVAVHNYGTGTARDVSVLLEENGQPRPAVRIAEIPPGETVEERFLVRFVAGGQQQLAARLESDPVAADNNRYLTLDIPLDVPVLLIDDEQAADARALSLALAPGGRVETGIRPVIETPRYLSIHPLDEYRVIYLFDVPHLDRSAIVALEEFVRRGGGLGIFLGEKSGSRFLNEQLYRDGEGVMPLPVAGPADLLVDRLERAPDLRTERHQIFRVFAGQRNAFLSTVNVHRYFAAAEGWTPAPDSGAEVIARLRNGAPLVVVRPFHEGRVVAYLTSAAPTWNNWGRNNPSYVVTMLETQVFLAGQTGDLRDARVGTPVRVDLDPGRYQSQVRVFHPGQQAVASTVTEAIPTKDGSLAVQLDETDRSGIYSLQLFRNDGGTEQQRIAVNVEPDGGNLETLAGPQLASRLAGVPYYFEQAASFRYVLGEDPGYNLAEALLYFLVALLLLEQVVAWWASYHPSAPRTALARGGAV